MCGSWSSEQRLSNHCYPPECITAFDQRGRLSILYWHHRRKSFLRIEKRDPDAELDYLRGRRRIVFELANDGAIITYIPTEDNDEDAIEFVLIRDKMVRSLAEDKAPKTPRGVTRRIHFDYDYGEDCGHNTYLGPLVHEEKDVHYRTLYYRTNWVQLDWARWVHLDRWRDADRAKEDVRQDLDIRLRGVY